MDCVAVTVTVLLVVLLLCSSAAGDPVEKTRYGLSGLRIECRPDPLWFRDDPNSARMEKAFGEAGVQARWISVVDPTGSPVFSSSFIPSNLDRLDEREQALKKWVDDIHKQGMAAMSWYPLILCKSGKTAHPEWGQVAIVANPPGIHRECNCCFNTGYGDALIEFANEAIDKFKLDGIWFDGSAWTQIWHQPIGLTCACSGCKALFKKQTGLDIPAKLDWDDPTFRRWVAWRFDTFAGYIGRLAHGIRKRHPNAAVVINHYHRPVIPWQSAIPLNPYDADIVTGSEASGEGNADLVSRLCRAYGRPQSEVWMPFAFGPDPDTNPKTDEDIHHALTCITAGAMPSYGLGPDAENAPRTAKLVAEIINKLKPYVSSDSVKYAALHVGQQTETFWFGRDPRGVNWAPEPYWQCILGWTQGLMEAHVPPDVIFDNQLTSSHLKNYKVLFMPLSFGLSRRQCEQIISFVKQGGTVVLGPAAGELDEWGEQRKANPLGKAFGFRFSRVPPPSGQGAVIVRLKDAGPWRDTLVTALYSAPELVGDGWKTLVRGDYGAHAGPRPEPVEGPVAARRSVGRGTVIVLGADFGGAVGWATPVAGGDTSIGVTEETAFSGKRSLKFIDGPDAAQDFYPDLEIKFPPIRPPGAAELHFSCRLRVDEGAVPRIEIRAWPDQIGPSLKIGAEGKLWAADKPLCEVPRGQWFGLSINARLAGSRTFDVAVTRPDGTRETFTDLPYPSATFAGSDWMVIYGEGNASGVFYVDDVQVSASTGGPSTGSGEPSVSAIIEDDFDSTPVGATAPQSLIPEFVRSIVDLGGQPVGLDGPADVRMGVFRGTGSEIVVHLHNIAGSRNTLNQVQGASEQPMTLTVPRSVRSARLALSGKALELVKTAQRSVIKIPPVALHEVVVLK